MDPEISTLGENGWRGMKDKSISSSGSVNAQKCWLEEAFGSVRAILWAALDQISLSFVLLKLESL